MTRHQLLDKSVCISYTKNNHGKCINPTLAPPSMERNRSAVGHLSLGTTSGLSKGKL